MARVNPIVVEALEAVIVVYALELVVVQGGEGDAETVLVVCQVDVRTIGQVAVDAGVGIVRAHQAVVYLQVFEQQGDIAFWGGGHGVEEGQSVCPAQGQGAVGQAARGAVVELVAPDAVIREVVGKAARLHVQFAQSMLGSDPEVALAVFLDARYVRAGGSLQRLQPTGGRGVTQQPVADGANVDVAPRAAAEGGGDEERPADATLAVTFGNGQRLCPARGGVQQAERAVEGGHQHLVVVQRQQAGDEGEPGSEYLHLCEMLFARAQNVDVGRGRAHQDIAPAVLHEGHGQVDLMAGHDVQPALHVPAFPHLVVHGGQPDVALAVHYHLVGVDVVPIHLLPFQVVVVQAVGPGGHP